MKLYDNKVKRLFYKYLKLWEAESKDITESYEIIADTSSRRYAVTADFSIDAQSEGNWSGSWKVNISCYFDVYIDVQWWLLERWNMVGVVYRFISFEEIIQSDLLFESWMRKAGRKVPWAEMTELRPFLKNHAWARHGEWDCRQTVVAFASRSMEALHRDILERLMLCTCS